MKNTFVTRFAIVFALFLFVGAGCTPASNTSLPSGGSSDTSTATAPQALSNCEHTYYPLKAGYSATYASRIEGVEDSEYTITVGSVQGNTAVLDYTFSLNETTIRQELTCEGGNVRALSYVNAANTGFEIETTSSSGEFLPKNLDVGSEWTSSYDVVMKNTIPNIPENLRTMNAHIVVHRKAVSEEDVTVPAGSFRAMKIVSKYDFDMSNADFPTLDTSFESTEYWVKDVGMVKSVSMSATTEATSFTTP